MSMAFWLVLGGFVLLLACERERDDSLKNARDNPQQYHNTAADPAGPGDTGPGANTGTGDD